MADLAEQAAAAGAGLQTLFQTLIELKETQDNDRRLAMESRQQGENEIYEQMRRMREAIEETQAIDRKQINEGF